METIILDNYNRKYGDKKSRFKKNEENDIRQFLRQRANRISQLSTEKKIELHGQDEAKCPKMSLLREIKLDTGTSMRSTMQQFQENGTFYQSMPIEDRKMETKRRNRQQLGSMVRNKTYTTYKRRQPD